MSQQWHQWKVVKSLAIAKHNDTIIKSEGTAISTIRSAQEQISPGGDLEDSRFGQFVRPCVLMD